MPRCKIEYSIDETANKYPRGSYTRMYLIKIIDTSLDTARQSLGNKDRASLRELLVFRLLSKYRGASNLTGVPNERLNCELIREIRGIQDVQHFQPKLLAQIGRWSTKPS